MNYHDITKCDLKNGEGVRVVLWVSHCEHYCEGCHNTQTWDKDSGIRFDDIAKYEIYNELGKDYVDGITFTGGDPLSTLNREEVLNLMIDIKNKFPNKTIWCYTGYEYDEIKNIEHMKYIDVLIDGKFVRGLSKPSPKWRGSSNQKIYYLNSK